MSEAAVNVKALVSLEYDGQSYRPGEWFKARPVDALTMGQDGRVSLNREYNTRAASASTAPAAKSSKRSYNRRDMVAKP